MPEECLAEGDELIPSQPVACEIVPFEEDRPTVVLWGDSHAWMYIPALEAAIGKRDVNLMAFVMGGCPPFLAGNGASTRVRRVQPAGDGLHRRAAPERRALPGRSSRRAGTSTSRAARSCAPARRWPAGPTPTTSRRWRTSSTGRAPRLFERLGELEVPIDVVAPTASVQRNAPLCEAQRLPLSCDRDRAQGDPERGRHPSLAGRPDGRAGRGSAPRLIDPNREMCSRRDVLRRRTTGSSTSSTPTTSAPPGPGRSRGTSPHSIRAIS